MSKSGVPVKFDALREWHDGAPDALAEPRLYEGIMTKRVFAYLVDLCAILTVMFLAWLLLGLLSVATLGLLSPLAVPAFPIVLLAYHTLLIGSAQSATLGMRLCDIEVRAWNGNRPGYAQAFLVTLVFYLSMTFTSGLILIVALFNDRRRLLHDFLCGTVVVRSIR